MTAHGRRWTLILAAFLVANVIAAVVLATLAHDGGQSRVVDGYDEAGAR